MITDSQRSIHALELEMYMRLGLPYVPKLNTTLNEKFGIDVSYTPIEGKYPVLKYLTIGVGGNTVHGNSGYRFSQHRPSDAALFEHVPFVIKPINNDLDMEERAGYRLRKVENIGGVTYACYYLKALNIINFQIDAFELSIVGDDTNVIFFDTTKYDLLNPTPREVGDPSQVKTNKYITRIVKYPIVFSEEEMTDLKNAIAIKYGNNRMPTELGVVSAVDVELSTGIYEVAQAQINYFINVDYNTVMDFQTATSMVRAIEIGGMEPMFNT